MKNDVTLIPLTIPQRRTVVILIRNERERGKLNEHNLQILDDLEKVMGVDLTDYDFTHPRGCAWTINTDLGGWLCITHGALRIGPQPLTETCTAEERVEYATEARMLGKTTTAILSAILSPQECADIIGGYCWEGYTLDVNNETITKIARCAGDIPCRACGNSISGRAYHGKPLDATQTDENTVR